MLDFVLRNKCNFRFQNVWNFFSRSWCFSFKSFHKSNFDCVFRWIQWVKICHFDQILNLEIFAFFKTLWSHKFNKQLSLFLNILMSLLLKFVHLKLNVEKNVRKKHLSKSRKRFEIEKNEISRYKNRRFFMCKTFAIVWHS